MKCKSMLMAILSSYDEYLDLAHIEKDVAK